MKNSPNINEVLAANITELMRANEHLNTLAKLAERSGLGTATIDRVKKALVSTSLDIVVALADAFHVDVLDLLSPGMQRENAGMVPDIWEVTHAMKELDPMGQTKVRIAALEARDLHLLHLAQMRSKQQAPMFTEEEMRLVEMYRATKNTDLRSKAFIALLEDNKSFNYE
jgi:transcriptional regulator with XRE-family HTH domain